MKKILFVLFVSSSLFSCTYDEGEMPIPIDITEVCIDTLFIHATSSATFSPDTLVAEVGNVITWIYDSDNTFDHTTTSTSIPNGLTGWDQPLSPTHSSYSYKITADGNYDFQCTPHASMGMKGRIIANKKIRTLHVIRATPALVFDPDTLDVIVGDTIKWVYDSNNTFGHTTTSTNVPNPAPGWDHPLDLADSTFTYVITQVGNYDYECTPHASSGMKGRIKATCK